jgi:hypothetical protein
MFFTVERVSMTLPHAHVIVDSSYFGCMPLFIVLSSRAGHACQKTGLMTADGFLQQSGIAQRRIH